MATADMSKAVGIWIRVSTEDQVRGESPEHHLRRANAYAEAKGWRVIEVYRLEAVSGKSVMAHPEAQRMLKDVRGGRISGLVFSKLARLARNTKELLGFPVTYTTVRFQAGFHQCPHFNALLPPHPLSLWLSRPLPSRERGIARRTRPVGRVGARSGLPNVTHWAITG